MDVFTEYISAIDSPQHRARVEEVFSWIALHFPDLTPKIAWNQPMFTHHGTFIIGFSVAKQHLAVSPEGAGMVHFSEDIKKAGYTQGSMLFRIPWESPVDYALLEMMIAYNIADKADCTTFWRK